jgi:Flp pilus assembly protein TadB
MIAMLVAGVAVILLVVPTFGSRVVGRRLRRLRPAPGGPASSRGLTSKSVRLAAAAGAGLAVAAYLARWWGLPVGVVVGFGVEWLLRRQVPAEVRESRRQAADDLPLGADLLAAALRAGAPIRTLDRRGDSIQRERRGVGRCVEPPRRGSAC